MTHCGLLRGSTSFHRTTMLGRYLSTVCLWTLRKHSTLHGLCTVQTYKYPYDTWSAVEFFLPTIYSLFYPRTIKPPSVYCFKFEPSTQVSLDFIVICVEPAALCPRSPYCGYCLQITGSPYAFPQCYIGSSVILHSAILRVRFIRGSLEVIP